MPIELQQELWILFMICLFASFGSAELVPVPVPDLQSQIPSVSIIETGIGENAGIHSPPVGNQSIQPYSFEDEIASNSVLLGTAPAIEWATCYGGTNYDYANDIRQTSDGGYIVAGSSTSSDEDVKGTHGYYDFWVVRLDSVGKMAWQKCLGGSHGDEANSIQQTSDGGYIVAGSTDSFDGNVSGYHGPYVGKNDMWVVKLDPVGNIVWQKCLGGTGTEEAQSIQQTSDGGYIVTGWTTSNDGDVSGNHAGTYDYWVVKLNSVGTIVWQKCLGGTGTDEARSIQQTSDGGYIVAGYSDSRNGDLYGFHGADDYWVVKLSSVGTIEWQKCLGGSYYDKAYSIQQTSDGGYIVTGYTSSDNGDVAGRHNYSDYWVVKLNSVGTIVWQKCLGSNSSDDARSIQQTSDGGYIVAGTTVGNDGDVSGNHGKNDYWIVKLNAAGTIEWQKSLGGKSNEESMAIRQTREGGFIVAGYATDNGGDVNQAHGRSDYWIVKLKGTGPTPTPTPTPIPGYGSLSVSSSPSGATIWVDNSSTNFQTPKTISSIPIGPHTLKLIKSGYSEYTQNITIVAYQTTKVSASLSRSGTLAISSKPTGAGIWIDGADTGKISPASISTLTVGQHTIRLTKNGYADYSKTVTIQNGKTTSVSATLLSTGGSIAALSSPSSAQIFIDNENTGYITPKTITGIPAGQHIISIKKSGYQDWSKTVTVRAGVTITAYGKLILNSPSTAISSSISSPIVQSVPSPISRMSAPGREVLTSPLPF
ncbi:MAG TPA: PEGA domain-containing protein [Methanospirillum sp.]|nr:PEGA domain-containing protein [Methanospirillum sp.]